MKRLFFLCLFSTVFFVNGQIGLGSVFDKTHVNLLVDPAEAEAGSSVDVAIHMQIKPKWHVYWVNPGYLGDPPKIIWSDLPEGIKAGGIQWPVPEKYESFGDHFYVYHDELLLIIPLTLSPDLKTGEYELKGKVKWLECGEKGCVPGEHDVTAKLVVGEVSRDGPRAELFEKWRSKQPNKEEVPKIPGTLSRAAIGDEREITLIAPFGKEAMVDFFPDKTKGEGWKISHGSYFVSELEQTLIRKIIKSEDGKWPEKIGGILRVEMDGKVQGYRTEVNLAAVVNAAEAPVVKTPTQSIWLILGGAFLGGLILNIMPCVLPVISMKILGFVQQSQESPERVRKLGLTYGLGVWASFLALAGVLISAKNTTQMASWGMQMQNPYFNLVLLLVVVLVALNLFGVFEVTLGGSAMTKASELSSREGFMGAFFNGVLATALATPCTAPFLAGAMGVALTQGQGTIIAAMSAVAFGLASPYVILSFRPDWLKFLPKPGEWMVQFKMIMGFPMLAAGVWILSFTGPMFGKGGVLWLGVLLVFVALAAWVFGEFKQRAASMSMGPLVACGVLLFSGYGLAMEWGLDWRQTRDDSIKWTAWSPEAEQEARAAGKPVLIDFTADWCITCKANKRTSIEIESVRAMLKEKGVFAMTGDYTNKDPRITKVLHDHRRSGVPLVLVYSPGEDKPEVLPVMLTPQIVLDALENAGKPSP